MSSSEILRRVALVTTDISEVRASVDRLTLFLLHDSCHPDDAGAKFLRKSVLTRATRRNIPEDTILCESFVYKMQGT
jgi:hypothetical protein